MIHRNEFTYLNLNSPHLKYKTCEQIKIWNAYNSNSVRIEFFLVSITSQELMSWNDVFIILHVQRCKISRNRIPRQFVEYRKAGIIDNMASDEYDSRKREEATDSCIRK